MPDNQAISQAKPDLLSPFTQSIENAMAHTISKQNIKAALAAFQTGNLSQNATALFDALGYSTIRQQPFEQKTYACFNEYYVSDNSNFNAETAKVTQWQSIDLLFQLSKDEVADQHNVFGTHQVEQTIIESYLFFALTSTIPEQTWRKLPAK